LKGGERKRRVLLVDDEPVIGRVFGLKLKLTGYDWASTTTGAEAIELVRTQTFDIMILDVLLPDMTGVDVLDRVRAFSQIPVILFSARADIAEVAKRCGADDYIAKPLNPDHLVEKIKALLERSSEASLP